jgi:hypothetical protein
MKRDFNLWLEELGASRAGENADRASQMEHRAREGGAIRFGQSRLDISDEMDLERDRARNEADHKKDLLLSPRTRHRRRAEGAHARRDPDAGRRRRRPGARAGYPIIVVPFGVCRTRHAGVPGGFDAKPARSASASRARPAASRG